MYFVKFIRGHYSLSVSVYVSKLHSAILQNIYLIRRLSDVQVYIPTSYMLHIYILSIHIQRAIARVIALVYDYKSDNIFRMLRA